METHLYTIRWFIIIFLFLEIALVRVGISSFGVVNDIYVEYFQISFVQVDWFTLLPTVGSFLYCFALVAMILSDAVGFRTLSISSSLGVTIMLVLLLCAYCYPHVWFIIYIGQLFTGISRATLGILVTSFAVLWFPESQIGFAVTFKLAGMCFGNIFAFVVPTQLLIPISKPLNSSNYVNSTPSINVFNSSWHFEEEKRFVYIYGSVLVVAATTLIFFIIFAADQPPLPPSNAQALLRIKKQQNVSKNQSKSLAFHLNKLKLLLTDLMLYKITFMATIFYSCNFLEKLTLGEILRSRFDQDNIPYSNKLSGFILVMFEIGGLIGSIVGGKILDLKKKYILQSGVAFTLDLLCWFGFIISYYFNVIPLLFICNALFGVVSMMGVIAIIDMIVQHFYPMDAMFVTAVLYSGFSLGIGAHGAIMRLVVENNGQIAALCYQWLLLGLGLVVCVLTKPNLSRIDAENDETWKSPPKNSEKTPLVETEAKQT